MNVLSGALNYIAGNDRAGGTSPVRRLVERIKSSALPQDRRKSVAELSRVVKEDPQRQAEIGQDGLRVIFAVLEQDRQMQETVEAALELLINLCGALDVPRGSFDVAPDEDARKESWMRSVQAATDNCRKFAEIPGSISLLTRLLEDDEFYVRLNAIELLSALVGSLRDKVTATVMDSPTGVRRLVDLLGDPREVIRNDALLLLIALSQGSEELATILTFENIFDKLFTIIGSVKSPLERNEDDVDAREGAMLVQDSLELIGIVLRKTEGNRTYFREANCIESLAALVIHPEPGAARMIAEDYENTAKCVELVQVLCSGEGGGETARNRVQCADVGLVEKVGVLPFDDRLPVRLQVAAVASLGQLVRQVPSSVARLYKVNGDPLHAAFVLMASSDSASMRMASVDLLWSFITDAKAATSQGFLSALTDGGASGDTTDEQQERAVQRLAADLKSTCSGWPGPPDVDAAAVFYSNTLLSWALDASVAPKLAKRRLLSAGVGGGKDGLLTRAVRSLRRCTSEAGPAPVAIGVLRFLTTWLHGSSDAVMKFLSSVMPITTLVEIATRAPPRGNNADEVHVQGLATLIIATCLEVADDLPQQYTTTLMDVVRKRIGLANFTARLDDLMASDAFKTASEDAALFSLVAPTDLAQKEGAEGAQGRSPALGHGAYYDNSFTVTVNDVYEKVRPTIMQLVVQSEQDAAAPEAVASTAAGTGSTPMRDAEADSQAMAQYKEIIRSQDEALEAAKEEIEMLTRSLQEGTQGPGTVSQVGHDGSTDANPNADAAETGVASKIEELESELVAKDQELQGLASAYAQLEEELAKAAGDGGGPQRSPSLNFDVRLNDLKEQVEDEKRKVFRLETSLMNAEQATRTQDAEVKALRNENDALKRQVLEGGGDGAVGAIEERRHRELAESELTIARAQLEQTEQDRQALRERVIEAERGLADAESNGAGLQNKVRSMQHDMETVRFHHKQELELERSARAERESELATEVERLGAELHSWQTRDTEREMADLRGENDELKQRIVDLGDQVSGLGAEAAELRRRRDQVEQELEEVSTAHLQLKSDFGRVQNDHQRENTENQRLGALVRELQASSQGASDLLDEARRELSAERSRAAQLQDALTSAQDAEEAMRRELEVGNTRSEDLTEQIVRLSDKLVATEDSRQGLEAELETARQSLAELGAAADLADARRPPAASTAAPHGEADESEQEMSDLKARLAETQNALLEAEDDLDRLRVQLNGDQGAGAERAAELERLLAEAVEARTSAEEGLQAAEHNLRRARLELEEAALESERAGQDQRAEELGAELEQLKGAINEERRSRARDADELQSQLSETVARLREVEGTMASLNSERDSLLDKVAVLEDGVTALEAALAGGTSERNWLERELEAARTQLANHTNSVRDLVSRFDASPSPTDPEQAGGRIEEVEKLVQAIRADRDAARGELQLAEKRNEDLASELRRCEVELGERRERTQEQESSGRALERRLDDEESLRREAESALAELRTELGLHKEEAERSMKGALRDKDNTIDRLTDTIDRIDQELSEVRDELGSAREELDEARAELSARAATASEMAANKGELLETISELESQLAVAARELAENAASAATVEQKLMQAESELEGMMRAAEERSDEINAVNMTLRESAATAEAREAVLQSQLNDSRQALRELRSEHEESLRVVQQEAAEHAAGLRVELGSVRAENEEYASRLSRMEDQIAAAAALVRRAAPGRRNAAAEASDGGGAGDGDEAPVKAGDQDPQDLLSEVSSAVRAFEDTLSQLSVESEDREKESARARGEERELRLRVTALEESVEERSAELLRATRASEALAEELEEERQRARGADEEARARLQIQEATVEGLRAGEAAVRKKVTELEECVRLLEVALAGEAQVRAQDRDNVAALERALAEERTARGTLEDEKSAASKAHADELAALRGEAMGNETKLGQWEQTCGQLEAELTKCRDTLVARVESLEASLAQSNSKLAGVESALSERESENAKLESELSLARADAESGARALEKMELRSSSLSGRVAELNEDLSRKEAALVEAARRAAGQKEVLEAEVSSLKARLDGSLSSLAEAESAWAAERERVEADLEERGALTRDLRREVESLSRARHGLESALEEERARVEEALSAKRETEDRMATQLRERDQELDKARDAIEEAMTLSAGLKLDATAEGQRREALEEVVSAEREARQIAEMELASLRSQHASVQDAHEELESEMECKQARHEALESELEAERARKEALEGTLSEEKTAKEALEVRLSEETAGKEVLEGELSEERSAKRALEDRLSQEGNAKGALEGELSEERAAKKSLTVEVEKQREENGRLERALSAARASREDLEAELDRERARGETLSSELGSARESSAALANELREARRERDGLQSELSEVRPASERLQNELAAARLSADTLEGKLREREAEMDKRAAELLSLQRQKTSLEEALGEARGSAEDLQGKLTEEQSRREAAESGLRSLEEASTLAEEAAAAREGARASLEADVQRYEDAAAESGRKTAELEQKLQEMSEQGEAEAAKATRLSVELSETRHTLTRALDGMTRASEALENAKEQNKLLSEQLEDKRELLSISRGVEEELRKRLTMLEGQPVNRQAQEDLATEATSLRARLDSATARCIELEQELAHESSRVEDEVLKELWSSVAALGARLPALNRKWADGPQVLSRQRAAAALQDVGEQVRALESELASARESLLEREKELRGAQAQLQQRDERGDSDEQVAALRIQLSSEIASRKAFGRRVADLEEELKAGYLDASRSKQKHEEGARAMQALSKRVEELQAQSSRLEADLADLERRKELEAASLRSDRAELEKAVEEARARALVLEEQLEERIQELGDAAERLQGSESARSLLARDSEKLRELEASVANSSSEWKARESELKKQLEAARRQLAEVRRQNSQYTSSLASLEEEVRASKASVERMRRTRDLLDEENARIRKELEQVVPQSSADSLEQQVNELQEERDELLLSLEQAEAQLETARNSNKRVAGLEQETSALTRSLNAAKSDCARAKEETEAAQRATAEAERRAETLTRQSEDLQLRLEEAEHELAAALEERLNTEMALEEARAQSAAVDHSAELDELQRKVDDLMVEAAQARAQASQATAVKNSLEERVRQLQRRSTSSEGAAALAQRVRRLETELRERDAQVTELEKVAQTREDLLADLTGAHEEAQAAEKRIADLERRLEVATAELSRLAESSFAGPDPRMDEDALLERDEQILELERERSDLARANADLEDRLRVLSREKERAQPIGDPPRADHDDGGRDWEAAYRQLMEEHEEALQCLAEMEVERSGVGSTPDR